MLSKVFPVLSPRGAFYVFPKLDLAPRWNDDKSFVLDFLSKTGVISVYGSGFGKAYGSNHFRLVYLPAEEVLDKAMDRLEGFIAFFFLNCICVVGIETAAKKGNRYTKWFLLFMTLYFTLTSACLSSNVYSKEKTPSVCQIQEYS